MEEFGVLIFLLAIGGSGVAAFLRRSRRKTLERQRRARWRVGSRSDGGHTEVYVERVYQNGKGEDVVLNSSTCALIAENHPDWEQHFHEAMSEAHNNAAARNSELT